MATESLVDPMRTLFLGGTVTVTVPRRSRISSVVIAATIAALVPAAVAAGTFVSVALSQRVDLTP